MAKQEAVDAAHKRHGFFVLISNEDKRSCYRIQPLPIERRFRKGILECEGTTESKRTIASFDLPSKESCLLSLLL